MCLRQFDTVTGQRSPGGCDLGGATGAALVVSIASAGGAHQLIDGWNIAALVSAGLAAVGVAIVASCRTWRRRNARPGRHRSRYSEHLAVVATPSTPPTPHEAPISRTAGGEDPQATTPHQRNRRTA